MAEQEKNQRLGTLSALGACFIWGVLPLYWQLLAAASAYEILAQRMVWSFVFMLAALAFLRRGERFLADCRELWAHKRRGGLLLAASVIISLNWFTYIWAVNHGHVLDTSIGYYINPLMSVLLGVVVFHEHLTPAKKISIVLASVGIAVMAWQMGKLPWIAVVLAVSFSVYGAVKKKLQLDPFSSITLETLLMLPLAIWYLVQLSAAGGSHFGGSSLMLTLCLLGTGVVTASPLILFSYGANLLPLNVLGFFQYIGPTMGFLLGVFYFREPFSGMQLLAFAFVWAAVLLFTLSDRFAIFQEKQPSDAAELVKQSRQ